jgi:hypothetical protein
MASMPVIAAAVNTWRFPGYLPKIILSVVATIAVILVLMSLLNRVPTLLLALVQLFGIAGATVVSYVWQDEIPRAFAQLAISIAPDDLPNHVAAVKVFMWLTVMLCTLPSTLSMGAMFPLAVRLWTTGGSRIARDVATVYTFNTFGSILGAWLPGFVLFALIGAERTLHIGIALNMLLALMMLIAGVADPTEQPDFWSWRRFAAIGLPIVAGLLLAASAYPQHLEDWRWWTRVIAAIAFGGLSVLEYTWLKHRSKVGATDNGIALAMVVAPLVVGFVLAGIMVETHASDPWALGIVYGTLRVFIVLVVMVAAWANYREHYGAAVPTLGEARGGSA